MTDNIEKKADTGLIAQPVAYDTHVKQNVTHVTTVSDAEALSAYKRRAAKHKAAYDALKDM